MKEILKQFKWLILFCLVSPFIVYIILITPSPIGIVAREDVGALLGYYGAILGGFMTLSGVWWTIDAQNKQRDEDNKQHENERLEELSIRYKPYILLEHVEEWNQYSVINYDGKKALRLKIHNIGRGEAVDLKAKVIDLNFDIICSKYIAISTQRDFIVIIPQEFKYDNEFIIELEYKDFNKRNTYRTKTKIELKFVNNITYKLNLITE